MRHLLIPVLYLLIRYGLASALTRFWSYGPEAFEAVFIATIYFFYAERPVLRFKPDRAKLTQLALCLLAGFAIYRFTHPLGLIVPFDLSSFESLLFLGLLGPILEELLFRQALWFPLERAFARPRLAVIGTTILFAAGHLYAYPLVPPAVQSFVIYQTIYVTVMGAWWGLSYEKNRSIGLTILFHILFNAGFYLGSLI